MFRPRLDKPSDLKNYHGLIQASYFADHFEGQLLFGAIAQDAIGWNPIGGWRIEAGGATGGCAVQAAALAVGSGVYDYSIILGWEKMSMVSTNQGTEFIAHASDTDFDFEVGGNYTGYYAAMAQEHICKFGTNRMQLAKVAVKNRNQAQSNPFAQSSYQNPFATKNTSGYVNAAKIIGDDRPSCSPLNVLDACMMSDAASAMLIVNEELAWQLSDHPIKIKGMGAGTDTMRTGDRVRDVGTLLKEGTFYPGRSLLLPHENTPEIIEKYAKIPYPAAHSFLAGRSAAIDAYRMAGITNPVKDLMWLETHDAFTSSEIQALEDFGVAPYGEGGAFLDTAAWDDDKGVFVDDFPQFGFGEDKLWVTLSGGLLGSRHGVGDTGVFQCIDTMWRLQGKIKNFYGADAFQPPVETGTMAADHSHAGTGCYVTITIFERPEFTEPVPQLGREIEEPVINKVKRRIEEQRANAAAGKGVWNNDVPAFGDVLQRDGKDRDGKTLKFRYDHSAGASIIHNPYTIDYYKTRGRVSPFFDNLGKGKLLATYCPEHGVYMAPIANCRVSDCLQDISDTWCDLSEMPCHIQTWTTMHYAGPAFKNDLPFHNIIVEWGDDLPLVDYATGEKVPNTKFRTSFTTRLKLPEWLKEEEVYAGMPLKPCFNTENPAGRMKDLWFEPLLEANWKDTVQVDDARKGQYAHLFS